MMRSTLFTILLTIIFGMPAVVSADVTLESAVTRVSVGQGGQWTGAVNIINTADSAVFMTIGTVNLERNAAGIPEPVLDMDKAVVPYTLAGWMKPAVRVLEIPAKTRARLPVTISIPEFAAPGVHAAAVLLRQAPDGRGTLQVSSAVAAAFEVTVTGDARHEVSVVRFGPVEFFMTEGPVPIHLELDNKGTTAAVLRGALGVDSLFGNERGRLDIVPDQGPQLYPGSRRSYELIAAVGPGIWRSWMTLSHGSQEVKDTAYFIVLPWPALAAVFAGLLLIIWSSRRAVARLARKMRRS